MQAILLSIKPEFADLIFAESKRYEFRRIIFKSQDVRRVVVYSSSPVQKVIGEFEIKEILTKCVKKLWRETRCSAGIDKKYYDAYFDGKDIGHAIAIKSVKKYLHPKCLKKDFNIKYPPQSFRYLDMKKGSAK